MAHSSQFTTSPAPFLTGATSRRAFLHSVMSLFSRATSRDSRGQRRLRDFVSRLFYVFSDSDATKRRQAAIGGFPFFFFFPRKERAARPNLVFFFSVIWVASRFQPPCFHPLRHAKYQYRCANKVIELDLHAGCSHIADSLFLFLPWS